MKFKIKIDTAIQELEKNLRAHVIELDEAMEVWVEQTNAALVRLKDAVNVKGVHASNDELHRLFYTKPRDNRLEYATYLGALRRAYEAEMSPGFPGGSGMRGDEPMVELDEDDYRRIFNDEFDWRVQSKMSNSLYKK